MAKKYYRTKKIVVGFSTPKKPWAFAAAIRWIDKTAYSHSYIRFESESWGVDFIYQQAGLATHFISGHKFEEINNVIREFSIPVTAEVYSDIGRICVTREGRGYGVRQVIGKGIVILLKKLSFGKINIKNPLKDRDGSTDCIEEVARVLSESLSLDIPIDMDTVSVKPFYDFIDSIYESKMVRRS